MIKQTQKTEESKGRLFGFKLILWVQLNKISFNFWIGYLLKIQKFCALTTLFSSCFQSYCFSRQNPPFRKLGILFLTFVWVNICLYYKACSFLVLSLPSHPGYSLPVIHWHLLFHHCLCQPQILSLIILSFTPQVTDNNAETASKLCKVSWWFLLMIMAWWSSKPSVWCGWW